MDEFTLEEFWLRSMEPVYNLDTGELINATKMNEDRNLEVCEECKLYGTTGTDHCEAERTRRSAAEEREVSDEL